MRTRLILLISIIFSYGVVFNIFTNFYVRKVDHAHYNENNSVEYITTSKIFEKFEQGILNDQVYN